MPPSEKKPRRKLPPENETAVLMTSARRCALCFQLDGDLTEKVGQIAHLDGDCANIAPDNLAWLCMPHHSQYDSTTSQHKNYTIAELKRSRSRLYQVVASGEHLKVKTSDTRPQGGLEEDRKTFDRIVARLVELLGESGSKAEARTLTDAAFERLLPPPTQFPPSIHRAMRHSVFVGGKRLRPILCMESARMVAGRLPNGIVELGAALEMLHTYSLIHDDLPALDNDDLRRGRPTCHRVFGEAIAILAGDALQSYAFEVLTGVRCQDQARIRIVKEIARAVGTIDGLLGGQVADLEATSPDGHLVEYIHHARTGALIIASLVTGAIYADASYEELTLVRQFGRMTGLAFQIADDILDVIQTGTVEKGITYPNVYGLEASVRKAAELVDDACAQLVSFGSRGNVLAELARFLVKREE
jgi:geranylgeranyl diphosphate synthase type II